MTRGAIRAERRARAGARKRKKQILIYVGVGLLAFVFIASLLVPGGLQRTNPQKANQINTGGPVAIAPDDGRGHIDAGVRGGPYSTTPATSGPHWQTVPVQAAPDGAPARWGFYAYPLPDEVLIHNLEHGGIGLHYDCPEGCASLIEQLKGIVGLNTSMFIVSPYPKMGTRIAITAWRHLMPLAEFDEAKIRAFIEAYQDRAPESVPQNLF